MSFGGFIQANTQVVVIVGPFVDVTDGFTPETGVTLSGADEAELLKHGSSTVVDISGATWAAVTGCDGYYALTLTTSHTDTEGLLTVVVQDDSVCLPMKMTWEVIAQAAYASLITAKDTGFMDVNLKALSEDTTAADNAEAFFDGTGYAGTNNTIPTVTTITNAVTLANGAHGGAAASLNLGAGATISSADGHALTLTGGTNGHGLLASGAGTGSGIAASGGSTSGSGIYAVGDADGMGIFAVGGDSALGLTAGLFLKSNSSGTPVGLYVEDGAIITDDAGTALMVSSTGGNGDGVTITGNGSGGDLVSDITGSITSVTNVVSANVTQWLGSAAATPTVAGVPEVDMTHVSGVVTTATLDSLSSQLSAIGSGTGAALNFSASDDNANGTVSGVTLAAVGTPTGTFSNMSADDASNHVIASADVAGTQTITWAYGFNCGVARSASKVTWKGTLSGTGPAPDTFTFAAWNGSTWDTRLVVANSVATAQTFDIPLLSTHTTTTGLVILRITFAEADAGTLTTNLLLVQAQQSGSLVGYSDGAIWYNSNASNTNTVPYVDGVADNPVSSLAAVLSLAVSLKIPRVRIANGSTMTLNAAIDNYSLVGQNWSLALGGQSISGSYIEGATITGTATGASPPEFYHCHFVGAASAPTVPPCTLLACGVNTTATYPLTAGSAGQFLIVDCFSEVEGSGTPYFSFPGACKINIRRWAGGTNVTLNNSAANMTIEVLAGGGQTIALGGADAEIRGICRSVSLTGVTTDSTVQIDAVTGPISIAGADGTVNIYGVCGVVTDSRTGTPLGTNSAISRVNINAEVDTAFADYDPPTNTEFEARSLPAADYVVVGDTLAAVTTVGSVTGNVSGSIGSLSTQAKADVNAEVDAALNTAIPGSPTEDSINERIVALDTGVNITRVNNLLIDGAGTELDPWGPAPT